MPNHFSHSPTELAQARTLVVFAPKVRGTGARYSRNTHRGFLRCLQASYSTPPSISTQLNFWLLYDDL